MNPSGHTATTLFERTLRLRERLGLTPSRYFLPNLPWTSARIGIALAVAVGSAIAFWFVRDAIGTGSFLLFAFPAVVFAAWLGRFVGGFIATSTYAFIAALYFAPPSGSLRMDNVEDARAILFFVIVGSLLSLLVEGMHAGKRYAEALARERQTLAEELVLERERIEVLLANLPGLVWEMRVERGFWPPPVDFASASAWRLTGHPAESWVGSLLWDSLLPAEEREGFENAVRTAIAKGSWNLRHRWCAADGRQRIFDTHLAASQRVDGTLSVRCVSLDVTELESAERALADTEQRFRDVLDHAPILVWIAEQERGSVWCNRSWLEFRGRGLEEELGFGWRSGVHPDDAADLAEVIRLAFEHHRDLRTEFRIRRADGAWRWLLLVGVPRRAAEGELRSYLSFFIDVSERKQFDLAREELLRETERARVDAEIATKTKDDFLAKVSHELRNPLNGILGWTQILASGEISAEELEQGVRSIDSSARALARLVDDLLDVSRILAGKMSLTLAPVELKPIIDAACGAILPDAQGKGVAIDCECADGLVLHGDPQRLQQVVWNLLSNAVKFTATGGVVELRAGAFGGEARIQVRDNGAGIDENFVDQLFEPFSQAEGGPARRHQGLGLGLSIVRQLVERHGGRVDATSRGVGRGSTFTVCLPILVGSEPMAEPGATMDPTWLAGLDVLVVDDDLTARQVLRTLLTRAGATVREADSAGDAMRFLEEAPPHVLVSDLEMPGEDGYSLVRRIRSLPATEGGNVPALAVTAYARETDRAKALAAGFQDHLPKPLDSASLVGAVARLAGR